MTRSTGRTIRFSQTALWLALISLAWATTASAQTGVNAAQQLSLAGLRASGTQGRFVAVQTDTAGDLYVLYEQGDGVRVLELTSNGTTVEAQAQFGAAGDLGIALALDPAGDVYVTGTSTSGQLAATSGAAIATPTAGTTNSFVAKLSPALTLEWLTFTGGSRIAASALAANAGAVYVTGITYGADLPVTETATEQAPAYGSMQNGFVESFSADGSTLLYATYLTGANGDTTPGGIAVDGSGDAWVVGATSATGFPTIAALIPNIVSNPSGFALELTPAGDGLTWSTFVPGAGLSAVALDSTGGTLLIAGAVSLGQFPVDTVTMPLAPTTWQALLRITTDGLIVESGTVIAPGLQSTVAAGAGGSAWIGGEFAAQTSPILPSPPLAQIGDGYAVRTTAAGTVDQTARFGGIPDGNLAYASLPLVVNGLAVDPAGDLVLAGTLAPTASADLLGSQRYELVLRNAPTAALPSSIRDGEQSAGTCGGSLCAGSSGYLATLNPAVAGSALSFAGDNLPLVSLRNLGSAPAGGLTVSSSAGSLTSTCPSTLAPGAQCDLLLSGGAAGTLVASTNAGDSTTLAYGAYTTAADTIVFSPKELDFGIQTAASTPGEQILTVTNLGSATQTFLSSANVSPKSTSPFSEAVSDCTLTPDGTRKILPAGASCHITVAFSSAAATLDGFVTGQWTLGASQVLLTGYQQAAALSVSAAEVDFGTVLQGGLVTPRFLYLSNSSSSPVTHSPVALPADSPFTVTDGCPATLAANTVCRLRIDYASPITPSTDSVALTLDQGITVLVTGSTVAALTLTGSSVNPTLSVTPASATFATPVVITETSGAGQTIAIANAGASAFPLSLAITGDFSYTSTCGTTLAGGATCTATIAFVPSQPGLRDGLLSVTAGAGSTPALVALSGTAVGIFAGNNGALSFGSDPVGEPLVQFYRVTQPFTQLAFTTSGPYLATLIEDAGYGHGMPPVTDYIAAGTGTCLNCWLAVLFDPAAAGPQNGTLTLTSTSQGSPYTLQLSGSGLAASGLIVTPGMQPFGPVAVNSTSAPVNVSLTNLSSNGSAITVSPPTVAGSFVLMPPPAGVQGCSASLAYGATCFTSLAFAPTALGTASGTLTFATSAGAVTAALSGMGIPDSGVALSPASLSFSPGTTTLTVQVRNTGPATLQVGAPTTGTSSFSATSSCGSLASMANCTVTVVFSPGAQPVSDTLTIPVTSGSGSAAQTTAYLVPLAGTYAAAAAGLALSPDIAQFGPSATGQVGPERIFTLTNLTAGALSLSTDVPPQFALLGAPCSTVAANGTCSFTLISVPLVNGANSGTIVVAATPAAGGTTMTTLSYAESYGVGSGTLQLAGGLIVAGVYNFGQVASGQTASQTFTLTAGPAAPVTIRRITTASPFAASSTCTATLAAGAGCSVTVTFAPLNQVASGTLSATATSDSGLLTIESDAQTAPTLLLLAGQAGPTLVSSPSNSAPLAAFSLSSGSLTFPATQVGDRSPAQTLTLTNSGTVPLHIAQISVTPDFGVTSGCMTVAPAASCTVTIASTPQTAGTHVAALSIVSDAAASLDFVSLLAVGVASPLSLSPASLNFGQVLVGSSATLPVTLANTSTAPITIGMISATGDYTAGGDCPATGGTLAATASCTVQVTFAPTAAGIRPGTLSVMSSASTTPLAVGLTGTGTASHLVVVPGSLNFGSIVTGASANLSLTLTNQGSAALTGLTFTIDSPYAITIPCSVTSLAAGASCTVQITFSPTNIGPQTGTLTIASSDPPSPATVPLTGSGIANAGFLLTVNGETSQTLTIKSGNYATFALTATPIGSFAGTIALTCLPLQTSRYANCSLLPASLTLTGAPAETIATVNTVTLGSGVASAHDSNWMHGRDGTVLALLLPGLLLMRRRGRNLRRWLLQGVAVLTFAALFALSGCGGGSNAHYTAPGTYSFEVTANSTSGVALTQSVTLTIMVTAR